MNLSKMKVKKVQIASFPAKIANWNLSKFFLELPNIYSRLIPLHLPPKRAL